jgi:hypothetical protein
MNKLIKSVKKFINKLDDIVIDIKHLVRQKHDPYVVSYRTKAEVSKEEYDGVSERVNRGELDFSQSKDWLVDLRSHAGEVFVTTTHVIETEGPGLITGDGKVIAVCEVVTDGSVTHAIYTYQSFNGKYYREIWVMPAKGYDFP